MSQRTERIDELLRQEIGLILAREANDPRIGFATITEVETTPDLRHARVWVSVIGSDAERDDALAALRHAMHFVRRELGTRLRLKRIPDLHVRLDDSIERGSRILHLLNELEAGDPVAGGDLDVELERELPTPVARLRQEGDALEPAPLEIPPPPPSGRGRPTGGSGRRPTGGSGRGRPTKPGSGPGRKSATGGSRRPGRGSSRGGDAGGGR